MISMRTNPNKTSDETKHGLLTIRDVRDYLAVGTKRVLDLIDVGELDAVNLGSAQERTELGVDLRGMRVTAESLHRYIVSKKI